MKKRIMAFLILLVVVQSLSIPTLAAPPYKSYNYVETNSGVYDVASPAAYVPERILNYENLGVLAGTYEDLFIEADGTSYIVDSTSNAVLVFDANWKLLRKMDSFDNNGIRDTFSAPTGIFVTDKKETYIADTNNSRIVVLDKDGNMIRIITTPKEEILGTDFVFKPLKVSVSKSGRIFVVAKDVFEGLMELTIDGQFLGFIGSNRVVVTPIELFWKKVLTKKQNDASKSFIPVEYTNISLDRYGFIYAVTSVKNVDAPIKRLNPSGNDVLSRNPIIDRMKVTGDYVTDTSESTGGPSSFVDIVADSDGIYYTLDYKRGRIFGFDEDGNILFIFGGAKSDQKGTFFQPSAIDLYNGKILVLDKEKSTVSIFRPTEYTMLLKDALRTYNNGEYEKSNTLWNDILNRNSNLELAYVKSGFCLYRMGKYQDAMDHFILANARNQYSKAFVKNSKMQMEDKFGLYASIFVLAILFLVVLILLRKRLRKPRTKDIGWLRTQIRFSFRTLIHPFDNFWDMKHEKKGSLVFSLLIVFLYYLVTVIDIQVRAFLFNPSFNTPIDLLYQLRILVLPIVLFVIANWSITTFMEGKGKARDVLMVLGYAMVPMILFKTGTAVLSNFLSLNENVYLIALDYIGIGWFAILVYIGLQSIHEFEFGKTIFSFVLTFISMTIILFICFLFFSLIQEIAGFIYSIYKEITFRI